MADDTTATRATPPTASSPTPPVAEALSTAVSNAVSKEGSQGPQIPQTDEERIRAVIEDIRPYLQHDGGDCEFVSYENRVVSMRLHGACGSCPSSLWTLRMGIENAIREQVPEVESVRNVDQPDGAGPHGHPHP